MKRLAVFLPLVLSACGFTSDGELVQSHKNDDTVPYASDEKAEIAARDCGLEDWSWVQMTRFDGPQPKHKHFGYELTPFAIDEVKAERAGYRAWDMTRRVRAVEACLCSSFASQGVYADIHSPALKISIGPGVDFPGAQEDKEK